MDIVYEVENNKFNFRAGLIITNKDRILLEKADIGNFWGLVGGRVKMGETTKQAAIREAEEEQGIRLDEAKVILNSVLEVFFKFQGKKCHELFFVYQVDIGDDPLTKKQDFTSLDNSEALLHWFKKDEIKDLTILPKEVKEFIDNKDLKHCVIMDIEKE